MAFKTFLGNTNIVSMSGLKDVTTGLDANDATVTFDVVDAQTGALVDVPTDEEDWPRTMTYVSGSKGNYVGTIPHDAGLIAEKKYLARVTALAPGIVGYWEVLFQVFVRRITK